MKKYISVLLTMFLIPTLVNAETLTYDVCESGCEYSSLGDVSTAIYNISDLSDKDIVINVNSDIDDYLEVGSIDNMPNSVTINGNNHEIRDIRVFSKNINIVNISNLKVIVFLNPQKIKINNSSINLFAVENIENNGIKEETLDLSEILEIDKNSLNSIKTIMMFGNYVIKDIDLTNATILAGGGNSKIFNSKINKIVSYLRFGKPSNIEVYNSEFNSLKYTNINSENHPAASEYETFLNNSNLDASVLNYDIYDINIEEGNLNIHYNTYVYFDKEAKLKPSEKLNLADYLDYYTEDKEIEYTIEDESIAKIENKELMGLKEGSTKVTVTTDEGHIIYRINLVVEKETIPEKIDKMTIKVPITGSKIKAWVLIVGGILLGIVGICSYMLIKRKK